MAKTKPDTSESLESINFDAALVQRFDDARDYYRSRGDSDSTALVHAVQEVVYGHARITDESPEQDELSETPVTAEAEGQGE